MDLQVVCVILLEHSLLIARYAILSQAVQYPTSRYSYYFNKRDHMGDVRRRRQYSKKRESISLKPPPADWPEPELGAGDFVILDNQFQVTSISPLDAYQAKLEKEFLEQQQEGEEGLRKKMITKTIPPSVWSSSEEDLKKLLDPSELLKHNKKLRPLLNKKGKLKITKVKSSGKQGRGDTKQVSLASSKTAQKKPRRKSKSASSKITIKPTSRRGRKRKDPQQGTSTHLHPSKESQKQKTKNETLDQNLKIKRQRKNTRKFTFATNYQQEDKDKETKLTPQRRKSESKKVIERNNIFNSTIETLQIKPTEEITKLQGTTYTIEGLNTTEQSGYTEANYKITTTVETTLSVKTTSVLLVTDAVSTALPTASLQTTNSKRDEIRQKRKQARKEMKKVLEAEQLEGSFNDKSSNWTTSEKRKIPISSITSHQGVLGVLKQKIMNVIDDILIESPSLTREKDSNEENSTRSEM